MPATPIIECVPNFSEGRDPQVLEKITQAISAVDGVSLLDVDPGKATNRTVVTFVGSPENVIEAAFQGIKTAAQHIDMRNHSGEHPRMGATDVCPLIPISGISLEELIPYAEKLGKRVGEELGIPVYLYESAARTPERKNLATVRSGEYEGLADKLKDSEWKPDYGEASFNAQAGATAIGVRDFLIAYNVNLNTTSVRRANSIAFDIREKGRVKRIGNPLTGKPEVDSNGETLRIPGTCKGVKAIGWYIEEYGLAQISMNITDISQTSLHKAFEETRKSANRRGLRVTGSELVGLVPKKVMLDAGKYFLEQQQRSVGISEEEIIHIAVKSLGLDELTPFDPRKKIIEYLLEDPDSQPLIQMSLRKFANETASESMAPGGGSVSAYVASMGTALGTMVANLSSHKRGWDEQWEYFSDWAAKGQQIKNDLLDLVDKDTDSFNGIIEAFRMPKTSDEEKLLRKEAILNATKYAIEVPLQVMRVAFSAYDVIDAMVEKGNPNSITDAGVGALCLAAGIKGAGLNVQVNCLDLKDQAFVDKVHGEMRELLENSSVREAKILAAVQQKLS
jgi:glutamate formiminotransferase/formiminotetrahydrofolate cyclodeaminase